MSTLRALMLLLIVCAGCVQSIAPSPTPIDVERPIASAQFEAYKAAFVASLIEAADLAENGGTEKQVRDLIAERNKAAQVRDLTPVLASLVYPGEYDGSKTGAALRAIAGELQGGAK